MFTVWRVSDELSLTANEVTSSGLPALFKLHQCYAGFGKTFFLLIFFYFLTDENRSDTLISSSVSRSTEHFRRVQIQVV
jgi:hypothetical protein